LLQLPTDFVPSTHLLNQTDVDPFRKLLDGTAGTTPTDSTKAPDPRSADRPTGFLA